MMNDGYGGLCLLCYAIASPICMDFIAGSRWLAVGLDNGTVMVSQSLLSVQSITYVSYEMFTLYINR